MKPSCTQYASGKPMYEEKPMTQKYWKGDVITITLDEAGEYLINTERHVDILCLGNIEIKKAPIPEPFSIFKCLYGKENPQWSYVDVDENCEYLHRANKVEKIIFTPTSPDGGTYTVEKVK